jgi:polygalacturonase
MPTATPSLESSGAAGLGLATSWIQAAIDRCHGQGGGRVIIPAGRHVIGTLRLRSHVHLVLEPGAVLLGSHDIGDYTADVIGCIEAPSFNKCLIYAENETDIGLHGPGIIDGRGDKAHFPPSGNPARVPERPMLIRFVDCADVRLQSVLLHNAAAWCCHMVGCSRVWIKEVTIDSRLNVNNDGFDLDSCQDVFIQGCLLRTGDDAICIKSTRAQTRNERIQVSGCIVSSHTAGVKLGTSSAGGVRNMLVTHCVFHDCKMGVLKLLCVDGGVLENIHFSDLQMDRVEGPIFVRLGRRHVLFDRPKEIVYDQDSVKDAPLPRDGVLRDCSFRNIRATVHTTDRARSGILVTGVPGACVEGLRFENVEIELPGGGTEEDAKRVIPEDERRYPEQFFFGISPAAGAFVRHAREVEFREVRFTFRAPDARPVIVSEDTVPAL